MNNIKNLCGLPTPCYVIDEEKLIRNLEILRGVEQRTEAKILLAQKAFSCYHLYPMIGEYVSGTACSGLFDISCMISIQCRQRLQEYLFVDLDLLQMPDLIIVLPDRTVT